jgi:hypothetical protein
MIAFSFEQWFQAWPALPPSITTIVNNKKAVSSFSLQSLLNQSLPFRITRLSFSGLTVLDSLRRQIFAYFGPMADRMTF